MPTALLSVYDKSGIVEFAESLHQLGWSLVSSGGTARAIADADIPVTDVAELTGLPAILGHRVVTLHPKIHGGILADPTDAEHVADMAHHGIEPIDLVVVNLYPFSSDPGIELIDIGGPAMVRAAAKNHAHVGVLVDPADYAVCSTTCRRAAPSPMPRDADSPAPHLRTRRRTTPRSSPGSTSPPATTDPATPSCRRRSTSRSISPNRCGTARTHISRAPATARPGRRAGGTR